MIGFFDELGNSKQKIFTFQNAIFFLHFTAMDPISVYHYIHHYIITEEKKSPQTSNDIEIECLFAIDK